MVSEMSHLTLELTGETLTIDEIVQVARHRMKVSLSAQARKNVESSSQLVAQLVDSGEVIYGVTTGFGPYSEVIIPRNRLGELQRNLLISHASGVGAPFPTEVVRAAMLLRANTLAKGYSGIRIQTLKLLLALLNKGIHPIIPEKGSVGASGDLAPLSHMALVLIGEGEAEYDGEILTGAQALKQVGLKPVELQQKEGIALINGTQISTAIAALALSDSKNLIASAEIAAALSIEALEGVVDAFDARIHKVRPHHGQRQCAHNLSSLLKGSSLALASHEKAKRARRAFSQFLGARLHDPKEENEALNTILMQAIHSIVALDQQIPVESPEAAKQLAAKRTQIKNYFEVLGISSKSFEAAIEVVKKTHRVQDAYSLRCTPQVLGAVRDAIEYAARVVTTEINSATDNPLIFPKTKTFLSGGNFHGQPIALAMDLLGIALTSIGSIAERRIARLIDDKLSNGLPLLLLHPQLADKGVHYGLGLAHITAAALLAECQTLTTPASIRSIPTSANQEDHVSMSSIAARQAQEIIKNVEHIIAIELLCAAQAIDIRKLQKSVKLGRGTAKAYSLIRERTPRIPHEGDSSRDRISHDVLVHRDINTLWELVHKKELVKQIQKIASNFKE